MISSSSDLYFLAANASLALMEEAFLAPKPGLVDRRSSGSHADMDLNLMERSAQCLEPFFLEMAKVSWGRRADTALREEIGLIGREAEAQMLSVTGGVNTHKGAIWSLGLCCSVLASHRMNTSRRRFFQDVAKLASTEDSRASSHKTTHSQAVKQLHGLTGAKEEAQEGFPHIVYASLPMLHHSRKSGCSEESARINSLLALTASLNDTCVAYRGGLEALRGLQKKSREFLHAGGLESKDGERLLEELDTWSRARRVSPGGAADLLATTLFIDKFSSIRIN